MLAMFNIVTVVIVVTIVMLVTMVTIVTMLVIFKLADRTYRTQPTCRGETSF